MKNSILLILSLIICNQSVFGSLQTVFSVSDLLQSFEDAGFHMVRDDLSQNSRTVILQPLRSSEEGRIFLEYEIYPTPNKAVDAFEFMEKRNMYVNVSPFKLGDQIIWNSSSRGMINHVALRTGKCIIIANSENLAPAKLKNVLISLIAFTQSEFALQKISP